MTSVLQTKRIKKAKRIKKEDNDLTPTGMLERV